MRPDFETEEVSLRSGRISSIEAQKKDPSRVSVFIDGTFAFGLGGEVALQEGLAKGRMLSVEEQQRILSVERAAKARATALAYVADRARTGDEVRRRLLRGGFSAEDAAAALERLISLGYVNDEEYADRYATVRLNRRYGPRRVVQELIRRGISPVTAEEAVRRAGAQGKPGEQAYEAASRRAERLRTEPDVRKRRKKLFDFLVRRGYDTQLARETVQLLEENEWS